MYFLISCMILFAIYTTYEFVLTHNFQSPIIVNFQNPTPRKFTRMQSPVATKAALIKQVEAEELTDEQYIRQKFGNHGDVAVAIVKAESGLRADAVNPNNSNGTIDIGCWQVNSVHLKKKTVTIDELLDCKKATDWVYENLYLYQGFSPWVAFNSGSYLAKL